MIHVAPCSPHKGPLTSSGAPSKLTLLAASIVAVFVVAGCAQAEPVALQTPDAAPCPTEIPESEDAPFRLGGNVQANEVGLADVRLLIEVDDWRIEVCTGTDGRWSAHVPDRDSFTVTIDAASLPSDIAVADEDLTETIGRGMGERMTVNFFLGESPRETSAEGPADPSWLVPWVSIEGYTYDLVISASAGALTSDITSAPPGFTTVTVPVEGELTVTNQTPSRKCSREPWASRPGGHLPRHLTSV